MSQAGFTPIQLYFSTTAAATPSAGNLANGELAINITDGKLFYKDNGGVVKLLASNAGSAGDVVGPGSSTDNALVRFDSTTGKLVQNSVGILDDSGNLTGIAALTASGAVTLSGGTANGVAYLDGSKVLTTGSALTFDGTTFAINGGTNGSRFSVKGVGAVGGFDTGAAADGRIEYAYNGTNIFYTGMDSASLMSLWARTGVSLVFGANNAEQMRLTSTGLGIGTSSPQFNLDVRRIDNTAYTSSSTANIISLRNESTTAGVYAGIQFVAVGNGASVGAAHINAIQTASGSAALAFSTRNSEVTAERLRITSAGNVGIGTSSPSTRLEVAGDAAPILRITSTSGPYSQIQSNTAGTLQLMADEGNTGSSTSMRFRIDGAEVARFDSSGNLGLGITPSAWSSTTALQVGSVGGAISSASTQMSVSYNWVATSTGNKYITNGFSSIYQQSAGAHAWYTAPSGTAGNAISFTQAMTLGSDGLLQVGTTTGLVPDGKLQVSATGTGSGAANTVVGLNVFEETSGNKAGLWFGAMTNSNVGVIGSRTGSGAIAFQTYDGSWGERARIDSSGVMTLGTTAKTTDTDFKLSTDNRTYGIRNDRAGSRLDIVDFTAGSVRASIDSSGNFGIGTSSPSASAILDAQSTTKGVRMPNMTTTQKNAIASPAAGLMVFDTTLSKLCVYSGAAWETITSI